MASSALRCRSLLRRHLELAVVSTRLSGGTPGHFSGWDAIHASTTDGKLWPKPPPSERVRTLPAVGLGFCNENHPIGMNMDHFPTYKDHPKEDYAYRTVPFVSQHQWTYVKRISALFWSWAFFHLYYNYDMIFGEFIPPHASEWTDEELGIPADDEADPEYWGRHFNRQFNDHKYGGSLLPDLD